MDGRPYGKLLPRYAGPIAAFLCQHPDATRADLIDFIEHNLRRTGLAGRSLQVPQEVRPRSNCPGTRQRGAGRSRRHAPGRHAAARSADGVARRGAGHPAGAPLLLGRTQYAGAFLMLGEPLQWLDAARECFADHYGTLTRGLLTSAFAPIVGLERIWHLDEMEDLGFALLTGGYRCPSRYTVGGWRCHLRWYEVDAFCRRTCAVAPGAG